MRIFTIYDLQFTIFILLALTSFAQQDNINNQYLINKYNLSPAFTGHNNNFEAFAGYRQNWVGIDDAPVLKTFNINGSMMKNNGIGVSLYNYQAGIFSNLSAKVNYAHHISLGQNQQLSFGIGGGIYDSRVQGGIFAENTFDPVFSDALENSQTVPDFDFGIIYRFKKLYLGVTANHLLESDKTQFALKRVIVGHIAFPYKISEKLESEPTIVIRSTEGSDLFYEISYLMKCQKKYWLALTYKANNQIAATIGLLVQSRLALNYSYEFGGSGMLGQSGGTHEITLGFFIGKNENNSATSIFSNASKKASYYKWME